MKVAIIAFALIALTFGSFCDKYTAPNTTNLELMTTVVVAVFGKITTAGSPTVPFFDGTTPKGSFNYLGGNNTAIGVLATLLIDYFGQPSILNCSDGSVGVYQGPTNMQTLHANMPITNEAFEYFIDSFVSVLAGAGVSASDQTFVQTFLNGTRGQICNQPDCTTKSGVSTFAPFVFAIAAIIAALMF